MLEGFKRLPALSGSSFVSITNTGINFNANVVFHMDKAEYIIVLLNEETKQLAIQKSNKGDEDAIQFCRKPSKWKNGVRYNNRETQQIISKMMGWDLENYIYRASGFIDKEESAMIFDLSGAKKFNRRQRKNFKN